MSWYNWEYHFHFSYGTLYNPPMSLSHFIKFQKQNSSSLHELHAEDLGPPTCVSLCILKAMVKLTELESMWKALLLYRLWRGLTEQYRGDTQRWLNYTLLEPQILKTITITHLFLTLWYMVQALIARLWLLQGDFQDCTAVRNTLQLWVTWLQQLSLVCGSSLWHQRDCCGCVLFFILFLQQCL